MNFRNNNVVPKKKNENNLRIRSAVHRNKSNNPYDCWNGQSLGEVLGSGTPPRLPTTHMTPNERFFNQPQSHNPRKFSLSNNKLGNNVHTFTIEANFIPFNSSV